MNVSHESVGAKTGAAIAVFGVDVCLFCVLLFL
jgi:UDP-glucuronate decarboxylase